MREGRRRGLLAARPRSSGPWIHADRAPAAARRDGFSGQHHVRMNMYIARSEGGTFKIVKNLGHIDPKEGEVGL